MKYVALLSGGKDSCFNLLHCQRNGHELVAAATLSPCSGKDEIDSYMYQTVGQDAIALVAQALEIPLYSRVIGGSPIEQTTEYGLKSAGGGGIAGDETEDLYALLYDVLEHHPDIQAVSVGAILSNYQRVRVEHVCRRLSLTPLAYLWQRNQTSLLSEMISTGQDAILIKIAGAGLTSSDLAKSLSSIQPKLSLLHQRFGTHPCGEGGEYETLTIDNPLFKARIDIKVTEVVTVDESDVAPVAYLRIKHALLDKKVHTLVSGLDVRVPLLLERPFELLRMRVEKSLCDQKSDSMLVNNPVRPHILPPSVRRIGPWVAVGNVHLSASDPPVSNVGDELTLCLQTLQNLLAKKLSAHSALSELLSASAAITLFLPDLDGPTFSSANAAYASFFGASPPARACVGIGGASIGLDCLVRIEGPGDAPDNRGATKEMKGETGSRKALHVQSLSYWAPANIGPYSQAVSIPPYTFVSGQIGLIPSSLSLPSPSVVPSIPSQSSTLAPTLPLETALVLQHTARIIRAAPNSHLGDGSEGGFGGSDSGLESDMDDVSRDGSGVGGWIQLAIYYLIDLADVDPVRKNVELVDGLTPTLYAVLSSLPRGARIEKQVLVHSGRFSTSEAESSKGEDRGEDEQVINKSPEFVQGGIIVQHPQYLDNEIQLHYEISGFPPSSEACAIIFVRGSVMHDLCNALVAQAAARMRAIQEFAPFVGRTLSAKVFVKVTNERLIVPLIDAMFGGEMPALTVVPSHHITSRVGTGDGWDWAVTLMAV